ncbi:large subunit GTPase 1 homolog [Amphiura filiformis]|uniref:large subunit GTPase 1 homolog n=1 Tax=Amphiura filiformis TaxID=82378 RepID=UPI003B219488
MGKKKNSNATLGKSIIKTRRARGNTNRLAIDGDSWRHTSELNDGYDWGRLNLTSITEQSALDEFLTTAQLAGTEFTAEKLNIKVIDPQQHTGLPSAEDVRAIEEAQELNKDLLKIPRRPKWDADTTAEELDQSERDSFLEWRRQLALLQEKEHLVITPFERNLEFWRQLWRVIERSDIIIQIVDSRNPLLFRCEDLERYVKEVNKIKENMILISKADLLTPTQRKLWADYFSQRGVKVAFWSAVLEMERIKSLQEEGSEEEEEEEEEGGQDEGEEDLKDSEVEVSNPAAVLQDELPSDEVNPNESAGDDLAAQTQQLSLQDSSSTQTDEHSTLEGSTHAAIAPGGQGHASNEKQADEVERTSNAEDTDSRNTELPTQSTEESQSQRTHSESENDNERTDLVNPEESDQRGGCSDHNESDVDSYGARKVYNDPRLVNGEELIALFYAMHDGKEKVQDGITTVGMVGYPNVGKSSTINALLQQKKVPVSATPGRTKHFQTLFVEPTMCLCDCPGLTMPSFVSTKAEMVINGILPIDQLRDFIPPISLICHRIPRQVLETIYGINIVKPKEGEDPNRSPTAMEFINAYGYMRGYMTHKGLPDGPKSARVVLKDYVKGKLLYCNCPPGVDADVFMPVQTPEESKPHATGDDRKYASRPLITAEGTKVKANAGKKLDESFFREQSHLPHTKGVQGVKGFSRVHNYTAHHAYGMPSEISMVGGQKPWKKHNNKKSKRKAEKSL